MPVVTWLRSVTWVDRETLGDLAEAHRAAGSPVSASYSRPWLGWVLLSSVSGAFMLYQGWRIVEWLTAALTRGAARPLRLQLSVFDGIVIAVVLAVATFSVWRGLRQISPLWSLRDPVAASWTRAVSSHEIHHIQVEAIGVVMPTSPDSREAGPWYLFDLGDESALLVHGPEFERTTEFPCTLFA